jgi:phosphoglycolate phosphatase
MPAYLQHRPESKTAGSSAPARVIVFDLDGTLADTADDLVATVNALLARDNLAPIANADLRRMVGAGARALLTRAYGAHNITLSAARLEDLFHAFLHYYNEHICVHSQLFAGVIPALDQFEQQGWKLAICTNKIQHSSILLLEALGIKERMSFICGQNTFAYCKPDPRTLLDTIAACGAEPSGAIMVGDSRTDIETAHAAGVPVIAVSFGYSDVDVRSLNPSHTIDHFDELWNTAKKISHGF